MFTSNSGNRILKMIDFGSSLIVQESGEWTQFTGTLQYSAPEVIGSYAKCSGSKLKYSDMWSVGVITFCLVTGKSPFQRSHELEIKEAIYDAKYHYPNNLVDRLSSEVKDFISKLLVVESEKRMTAKDALLHPWITQSSTSAKLYPLDKDVLRGMQNLQVRSKLKREMMKVLMRKLKFEKRDELGRLFLQYDPSGKGILNLREISDVLNKGIGLDRDSAHVLAISIVRELDNSGVGRTQANVLHRLETMESIPLNQDTADQMISCLSEDKKAIISSTDIQEILSSENPSEGNFKNMANKIISDISKGGEQQFSPEEFVNYLNRTIENED